MNRVVFTPNHDPYFSSLGDSKSNLFNARYGIMINDPICNINARGYRIPRPDFIDQVTRAYLRTNGPSVSIVFF